MMRFIKAAFISLVLASLFSCTSIKIPKNKKQLAKKCRGIQKITKKLVGAKIEIVNNEIIVVLHPEKVAMELFQNSNDGIILELVSRNQITCDSVKPVLNLNYMGKLLYPMWKEDIIKNKFLYPHYEKALSISYGILPADFKKENYELNIGIIQKRYVCPPFSLPNLPSHDLQLLETGLYPYELSPDSLRQIAEEGIVSRFDLHFDQGETRISKEQTESLIQVLEGIKNISGIAITGYSSIEGTRKINERIFSGRAKEVKRSVEKAFPNIPVTTNSTENWVDFIYDVEQTPYAFLASRQKSTIKHIMEKRDLYDELEPILKNHRKVVVSVKSSLPLESKADIREQYRAAWQEEDLQRLLFIQNTVMEKIKTQMFPDEYAKELNVPLAAFMSPVIQNQLINMYELKFTGLMDTHDAMQELYNLVPHSPQILYNLIALKLKVLTTRPAEINRKELDNLMYKINKTAIKPLLSQRLKVNYYMVMVYEEYKLGNERNVRKLLSGLRNAYGDAEYSEADMLKLSNYFEKYGNNDYAEKALYPFVREGTNNKDLIFFYINLNIYKSKFYKDPRYQDLLEQAYELDNKRFCRMFNNKKNKGISFQLLITKELRERYCDWCIK